MAFVFPVVMDLVFLRCATIFFIVLSIQLTWKQFIKSFQGGSERFFALMWMSHISSFANLEPHLRILSPSTAWQNELRRALSDGSAAFESLITFFLKGIGVPCPALFADAKPHFSRCVDLSNIDQDGFRSRMFCWAATGSYDREPGAARILV